jgi:PEP-CTERM motif
MTKTRKKSDNTTTNFVIKEKTMKTLVILTTILAGVAFAFSAMAATLEVLDVTVNLPPNEYEVQITGDNNVAITLWVDYCPDDPAIWKDFHTNGVEGVIHLTEFIYVIGETPITDWHEELWMLESTETGVWEPSTNDDGLWWGDGTNGGAAPQVSPSAQVIPDGTDKLDIYFDVPVLPGEPGAAAPNGRMIVIQKDILAPSCETRFAVKQWPTVPEPSSAFLLAAGLFARRFRRRK